MIECINFYLEFIINISIVMGILFLIRFYYKLSCLDKEIEEIEKNFENKSKKEKESLSKNGGIEEVFNNKIKQFSSERDSKVASLKRERERIISKIPFIK